jgi:hypothetical protein
MRLTKFWARGVWGHEHMVIVHVTEGPKNKGLRTSTPVQGYMEGSHMTRSLSIGGYALYFLKSGFFYIILRFLIDFKPV